MRHVGWLDGDHVFDRDIVWRAFVCGDHLFCAVSNEWRGSRHGSALLDTTGLIVAWREGEAPRAARRQSPGAMPAMPMRPFRPKRPIDPRRPLFPQTPFDEWSPLSWQQWLIPPPPPSESDQPAAGIDETASDAATSD